MGGSGPIGLLTAAVLKGMGVTTIISELTQVRKEQATSSGVADHVLDPSVEDVPSRVRELTGGKGVDVAFECAGVNAVPDTMLDAVRPGAVVANVSIWGNPATLGMQKLVLKEIDLRDTIAGLAYALRVHQHFTAVSLWLMRVSKPCSTRSSRAILPVMNGLRSTLPSCTILMTAAWSRTYFQSDNPDLWAEDIAE